jgi:hypothetical protein
VLAKQLDKNIKISAIESLGYYELKSINLGMTKDTQNYYIKENELNCNGYRIQKG